MEAWEQNRGQIEQLLLDKAAEVTLLVDATSWSILGVRGPLLRVVGWTFSELVGAPVERMRPPGENGGRVLVFGREMLQVEQSAYYGEVLVGCRNGHDLTMSVLVHPFRNDDDQALVMVRLVDVTEQLRLSNELRRMHLALRRAYNLLEQQGEKLAEARRAASLSIFSAGMAHEMNNPVASARSNIQSLQGFVRDLQSLWPSSLPMPEELSEISAIGQEVAQDLERLSLIVRKLSELEAPIQRRSFDLVEVVEQAVKQVGPLRLTRPDELPMESDPAAIERILTKVLDNAVRAASPDGVTVCIAACDDKAVISVEDGGPGVADELRQRVFDPFFTTRPPGTGLGLGLFLARRAAVQLGGEIELEPGPDGGARVVCKLPLAMPEVEAPQTSYEGFRIG